MKKKISEQTKIRRKIGNMIGNLERLHNKCEHICFKLIWEDGYDCYYGEVGMYCLRYIDSPYDTAPNEKLLREKRTIKHHICTGGKNMFDKLWGYLKEERPNISFDYGDSIIMRLQHMVSRGYILVGWLDDEQFMGLAAYMFQN